MVKLVKASSKVFRTAPNDLTVYDGLVSWFALTVEKAGESRELRSSEPYGKIYFSKNSELIVEVLCK